MENDANAPLISIIIPARNEEDNIQRLYQELLAVTRSTSYRYEYIVVDNSSSDRTGSLIKAICGDDPEWKYVRFSRNFTVEMSITAGYHFASGDAMIVLYSDLQDPPDVIPRFLEKWREGYDVVYGVRTVRPGDPYWRNTLVRWSYRLIAKMSDTPIPTDAGDFRLISKQVRDALERIGEVNRYMRGLISWLGFRQIGVPYERQPRKAGSSKAPFGDLIFFVFNAVTSFSMKPLRIFTLVGFTLLFVSLLGSFIYLYLRLTGSPPPGITTLILLGLASIGINSLGIGILGEYIGRIYFESKRRPLYIVEEMVNVEESHRN